MRRIRLRLAVFLVVAMVGWGAPAAFAAIPADTAWEVETTGSDSNGGGFSVAQKGATGVDHSYGAGQAATTFTSNLSATGTTTLTCSGNQFLNTMLGNVVNISGQGSYCIQGFTSSSAVTVDRALGTFSTTTGVEGGALASPGKAGAAAIGENNLWIKNGTYTVTSATANVSGGCVSWPAFVNLANGITGYNSTRGDNPTGTSRPTIKADGVITTFTLITNGTANFLQYLIIDGNSRTSSRGVRSITGSTTNYCKIQNCTNSAFSSTNGDALLNSEVTGCSTANVVSTEVNVWGCYIHNNTFTSIFLATNGVVANSIIANNTGAAVDGIGGTGGLVSNCTIYGNGRDGVRTSVALTVINTISNNNGVSAAGYGFNGTLTTSNGLRLINCAHFGNATGGVNPTNVTYSAVNTVTLGLDPFISASTGNWALNTKPTGGALCSGRGIPGTYPGLSTTTSYTSIGATQTNKSVVIPRRH